jgi:hypothetical protein
MEVRIRRHACTLSAPSHIYPSYVLGGPIRPSAERHNFSEQEAHAYAADCPSDDERNPPGNIPHGRLPYMYKRFMGAVRFKALRVMASYESIQPR